MKKSEEKHLFERFSEAYEHMPLGSATFDDRPDVIFTTLTGEIIGIELTECIYNETLMKESEYQIKFNEKVICELEGRLPFKFHLDIELNNKQPLRQNQIKSTIDQILDFCIQEFANLNSYESRTVRQLDVDWSGASFEMKQFFRNQGFRKLPNGIVQIQMARYDALEKSSNLESKAGMVPDFTDDILESILTKKHKTLSNYKACDQQWLVIIEGLDFYSYMHNVRIEKECDTKFDRIFMFRRWPVDVIAIK